MSLCQLEEKMNSHIMFIYNNIDLQDAIIDPKMVQQVSKLIKHMNKYDKITLVLNTRGGNLASGYKLVSMLKEKYNKFDVILMERCGSTGTFIALAADQLYASDSAFITPTEPQMQLYDGSGENVSVAVIRNFIEANTENGVVNKLDSITYGNYISTILYFKNLCYNVFDEDKVDSIISFMLNEVNSHQQPLLKRDFHKMGIKLLDIPEDIIKYIEEEHEKTNSLVYERTREFTRHTVIRSGYGTYAYEKKYDQNKSKISEGYFIIEEGVFVKKIEGNQNSRVADIIKEMGPSVTETHGSYNDAAATHWDSYNDSYYHDKYNDQYDDYGDNSFYHDVYKDGIQIDAPKQKVLKPKKVVE